MARGVFILMLIVCWLRGSNAQQFEIAVQKGHSANINRVAFNSDGKLLASSGSDNLIILWHVLTGKEMASFISPSTQPVQAITFSANDDFLYVLYEDGRIYTWDIAKSTLSSVQPPTGLSFQLLKSYTSADGQYEALVDRFYLKKKNVQSGKAAFSRVPIDIAKNFTSVAVSEANNLILASNEDGKIYAFEWGSGKSKGILEGHYSEVNQVCFDAAGTLFASASSDRSIILWDAKTRKQVKRLFGRSFRFEALAFNHAGTQLVVGDELGKVRTIDLLSSRIRVSVTSLHTQKVADLAFSADESLVFSGGYDNRMVAYTAQTREKDHAVYKHYISVGDFLLKSFRAYREPYAWVNTLSGNPSGNLLAIGGSWRESAARSKAEPIHVKNLHTGKTYKLLSHQGGVDDICFISDINFVSVHGNELLSWVYDPTEDNFYYRKLAVPSGVNLHRVVRAPKNTVLLQSDSVLIHYDLKNERIIDSIRTSHEITSIACSEQGKIAIGLFNSLVITSLDTWHSQRVRIDQAHSDRITGVSFNPNFPLLATVSWDATVKLWNSDSATLKATIIPIGSDDHLIITPDNYYYGTKNSLRGIGFKFGKQFISPEQFDLRFNRPDIVLERLGFVPKEVVRSFHRAYQKRLQKMHFTEEMLSAEIHLPEVSLVTENLPVSTTSPQLSFMLKAADTKYNLDRLNVFINNVPLYGFQGINLREKNIQQIEQSISLLLSSGKNKIQVSCLNEKGVESLLQTFEVNYFSQKAEKPTLYVAVVSVSSYENSAMNLKYAAKDGRDLAGMFARSGWFDKVVVDSLLNSKATLENILALRQKFMQTSVNDQVILFISGHGLLDDNLDFYFATQDVDFRNPADRGLRYDDLENLLDGIPARKKLLLMDACHSGEVDKSGIQLSEETAVIKNTKGTIKTYTYPVDVVEEHYQVGIKTSFELMQELFSNVTKGSGAVVISAAAGNSYALESDEWRNGVFTFALINGLKSKAADENRDGEITVTELKNYVSHEVERLTRGAQKPTSRRENLEFDFRIR